jgi:ribose transport system permease protein
MLDSIAVVFIGATLHREYRPNLPGTLLGVLVFGVLTNGLNLMGVSADWQGAVRGLVLLGVLGLTIVLSKRRAVS